MIFLTSPLYLSSGYCICRGNVEALEQLSGHRDTLDEIRLRFAFQCGCLLSGNLPGTLLRPDSDCVTSGPPPPSEDHPESVNDRVQYQQRVREEIERLGRLSHSGVAALNLTVFHCCRTFAAALTNHSGILCQPPVEAGLQ